MTIHPTAVIDPKAELDSSVIVGPYSIIGPEVKIGAGSDIQAHVVLSGRTTIGENNAIGSFSTLGHEPQDLSYKQEPTELIIGNDNIIREYVSIHRGTINGRGRTVVGNGNMFMGSTHVAHDCIVGNQTIMANQSGLSGHVEVGDYASISGMVAIHQFCRIGTFSYVGAMSGISRDVPPYVIVTGRRNRMRVSSINTIALRRNNFDRETIRKLNKVFRILFRSPDLLLKDALEKVKSEEAGCREVDYMIRFFEDSKRGVVHNTRQQHKIC